MTMHGVMALTMSSTLLSGVACVDHVEGTDCSEFLAGREVPPIVRCFEPRTYFCDTEATVWRWETCCYCRDPDGESPGGSYCSPTCIDTGLPR